MDPELASEMVKLLAQELKVVRAQLREAEMRTSITPYAGGPPDRVTRERAQALVAENEILKANNVALQQRIARLQDELARVSSIKSEDDISNPLQYTEPMSHTRGEKFARLLAENEDLGREKEEASRNQKKLSILQEKYRRTKVKVHEYDEILNELRTALSTCTQELEQSRKTMVPEIDFRDFLNGLPYEPVEQQLEFSAIRPVHTKLHKSARNVCKGPYFINHNEIIWSPSGIALGLVVRPTFQYNPKTQAWTKFEDDFAADKQMDVCCSSGNMSRYLGTYERVGDQGTMVIAPETLEYLDRQKLDFISRHTTLFPALLPPSQTQMINTIYKQGVIKLQCFGIRCVAFNQTFADQLPDRRKRSSGSTVQSAKNKKRKH